jgi:hypothetical protein
MLGTCKILLLTRKSQCLIRTSQVILHHRRANPRAICQVCLVATSQYTAKTGSRCGEIKRLVMGLDRFNKTPCGFCFVEYYNHQDALDCMKYIGGTKLDERIIRTDLDPGFQDGRQYGYVLLFLDFNSRRLTLIQSWKVWRPSARRVPR